jgi:hypothetical protein
LDCQSLNGNVSDVTRRFAAMGNETGGTVVFATWNRTYRGMQSGELWRIVQRHFVGIFVGILSIKQGVQ